MSNREKLCQIVNAVDEQTAGVLLAMAENYLHKLEEVLDDAYCQQLLREARERGDENEPTVSLDDVRAEIGLTKDDL